MDCHDAEEHLGAYALDALDPDEAARVESHLEECVFCTALLREHSHAAASLSMAAGDAAPPESLKRATLKRVGRRPRRRSAFQGFTLGRVALAFTSSLSLMLVGVLAAIGIVNVRMSDQIDDLQQNNFTLASQVTDLEEMDGKLADMYQEQRSMSYIMASADMEKVSLEGGRDAQGVLLISSRGETGLLMARGLEPAGGGHGYYVWLQREGGQPFLVGRLTVDDTGWGALTLWPNQPIHVFQEVVVAEAEATPSQPVLRGSIVSR